MIVASSSSGVGAKRHAPCIDAAAQVAATRVANDEATLEHVLGRRSSELDKVFGAAALTCQLASDGPSSAFLHLFELALR
jgi:hypothetical protein